MDQQKKNTERKGVKSAIKSNKTKPFKKVGVNKEFKKPKIWTLPLIKNLLEIFSWQPLSYEVGKAVKSDLANECVKAFHDLYESPNTSNIATKLSSSYTKSVGFHSMELMNWLAIIAKDTSKVNNIRIVFGIYTQNYIDNYQPKCKKGNCLGRLTAFLWPYLDDYPSKDAQGNLLEPYNLGGLEP